MLKRDTFTFISNLSEYTCNPARAITVRRDGYLLSEQYLSAKTLQLLAFAKKRRNLIVSDNGNFIRMKELSGRFAARVQQLRSAAAASLLQNGVLAEDIVLARRALIEEMIAVSVEYGSEMQVARTLARQQSMNADLYVGCENLSIPAMAMAGLLDPAFGPGFDEIYPSLKHTYALFRKQVRDGFGVVGFTPRNTLMVLHGYDYASCYRAGTYLRDKKLVENVAISYGASMMSRNWISRIRIGRKDYRFAESVPAAYILSQSLTLGALNGLKARKRIHILGLGSPIMIVLSALFLPKVTALSIDSSAPLQDAMDGNIYGSRDAYLKMKMLKVAAHCLAGNVAYESNDPFFQEFERKYPSDWRKARQVLDIRTGDDTGEIEKKLDANQEVVRQYLPYFAKLSRHDREFMDDLRVARTGANYGVIREILVQVRRRLGDTNSIHRFVAAEVLRYEKVASPSWGKAISLVHKLTRENL